MTAAHAAPPSYGAHITAADLAEYAALLPASVTELLRVISIEPTLALLNAWPGVCVPVPAAPDIGARSAVRWAQIEAVVGAHAMAALAEHYGGGLLDVATCEELRTERRRRWMRAQYDSITRDGSTTKGDAVRALGVQLAGAGQPMSYRAIETALDSPGPAAARPSPERAADATQRDLFTPPETIPTH